MLTLHHHSVTDKNDVPPRRCYIKLRKPKAMKIVAKAIKLKMHTAHTTSEDQDDDIGNTFEKNEELNRNQSPFEENEELDRNQVFVDRQDTDVNCDDFTEEITYMEDNDISNAEDPCKHQGYLLSSDDEFNRPHNCKQKHNTDNLSEDLPSPQQYEPQLPHKIHKSKGHVAACNYEVAVQQLIKFAIGDFRGWLASQKFHAQTKDHEILNAILNNINDNGRSHARVDMTDVAHGDYLSEDEITNTIQEYMQVGDGRNESDDADEFYGESEDNEVKHE
ncbi:uncharacterized protein BJ212DRAFT_1481922 [Suillus subaureus]|uniref:Uncharacterized protein n=1 Tax=Suillus subaureus TaxID=48587 RepID=A0A9P7JCL8_9AGAM|nr:uncharacterized protein BJ212DRAFT_1481922 [Suillus subaureus]KAG1814732.1 hypothetical protein BJ212DRAFT_1481922 [Suillus subaureus]